MIDCKTIEEKLLFHRRVLASLRKDGDDRRAEIDHYEEIIRRFEASQRKHIIDRVKEAISGFEDCGSNTTCVGMLCRYYQKNGNGSIKDIPPAQVDKFFEDLYEQVEGELEESVHEDLEG